MDEQPCPICDAPMHPTMRDCYGHCGGEYCEGWTDSRDVYVEPEDPHAAAFGCTGTHWHTGDAYAPFEGYDGPAQFAPVTCGWMRPPPTETPMCTATDAHRAEQEASDG